MKKPAITMLLHIMLMISLVSAGELTYDMATGKITGFDLTTPDNPEAPGSYENSTEVWQNDGFVGRLTYRGDPTTLTFTNSGPIASGTVYNRFYFTFFTNGTTKLDRWREFFLVARVKGLYHNGSQHDFSGVNTAIATNGGSVPIAFGAGPELVSPGQQGYNDSGGNGTYNGTNGYMYRYKYQFIWVDVTVILTSQKKNLKKGYYITQFNATTTTNLRYTLQLIGELDPNNNQQEPSAFYFGIESVVSNPFPYTDLFSKNSMGNSLHVGKLRYFSLLDSADVKFSSNPAGTAATFTLTSAGVNPVPYSLVFDLTKPNENAELITSAGISYESAYLSTISPIDGSSTPANIIEGDLRIFLPAETYPLAGTYSSTIYCILTQT